MELDVEIETKVFAIMGFPGKMLDPSKSNYSDKHSTHVVFYNANLFTNDQKIWFGDIDVTISQPQLAEVARVMKTYIYVLREMDGRFENEENPNIMKAIFTIQPNGDTALNQKFSAYYGWNGHCYKIKVNGIVQ